MKKEILTILFSFSSFIFNSASAQILCIYCYEQNDSISQNVNNMVLNGSFENTTCSSLANGFCPNASYYNCDILNWTCTGGGIDSYANMFDTAITQTADGVRAPYFGNGVSGSACQGGLYDTSCMVPTGCEMLNIPAGYPTATANYGGSQGVSLEQTVSSLTIGSTYVLEFWAGGEPQSHGWMDAGVFAVDIGFGYTYLRNKPTCPGCVGTTFIIIFNATATSHTVKFTNWGHVCMPCTELILDNVRMYTLAELDSTVPPCAGANVSALFNAQNHICPGTCTDFNNLSLNATSFQWTFTGANPGISTDANPTNICYNSPGSYDVSLIATGLGGSDTLTLFNFITVYPSPPPQGILQNGDTLFANPGALIYQWFYNGNAIPGATSYFYVALASGDYNVVATDNNGCEVEAVINNVFVSIDPTKVGNRQMTIYPNPVIDELNVRFMQPNLIVSTGNVSAYNSMGEKCNLDYDPVSMTVDCSQLPPGIYYLEILHSNKFLRTIFVKSN